MIRYHDIEYLQFLDHIKQTGTHKSDRTGTGTLSTFGYQMRYDISHNIIPLLTSKKMHIPAIIHELVWYLSGNSNIKYLQDNGVRIWNEWADENGDLGPVYGYQWRSWPNVEILEYGIESLYNDGVFGGGTVVKENCIDQIEQAINLLKSDPDSRRIIVSAWNVSLLSKMKLPPCHYMFQFYSNEMSLQERHDWHIAEIVANSQVTESGLMTHESMDEHKVPRRWLSCIMHQRSADAFLGVPFNISQYSILTCLIAKTVGMATKEFVWTGGDCHIYDNLQAQVNEQLMRSPHYRSPSVSFSEDFDRTLKNMKFDDFTILNYNSWPAIKGKVAV